MDIHFLGEEEFCEVMNTEEKAWEEACVKQGTLTSFDGCRLNYYTGIPEAPRGIVVMVHGFCEFWAKYREFAWYLYQAGYGFYFCEHRGFGYSEGKLPEPDVVYIDDYRTYVEDLHTFIEQVVKKEQGEKELLLIGHSMGGCISALFLETYPGYFKKALLCSPMMKLKGQMSGGKLFAADLYATLFGKKKTLAPGQKRFDGVNVQATSSSISKTRYDYQFDLRLADPHYQTSCGSLGWALASMKAIRRLMKNAGKIQIPVTLFSAGGEQLLDPAGYDEFKARVPQTKVLFYENSKHEIMNAGDETRIRFFKDVLKELEES